MSRGETMLKTPLAPLTKARQNMVTAITQWHGPLSLHGD